MPQERLSKIIANHGITSRRKAEVLIEEGRVCLNRKVVKDLGRKADRERDVISVDGVELEAGEIIYLAMNKPRGYISTRSDTHDRKTVYDLLPKKYKSLHTVGRLDKETSGLLLFTNDGDFTHQVTHPKFEIRKKYRVSLEGAIDPQHVLLLRKGFEHPEFKVSPCGVEKLKYDNKENKTRFVLDIGEGKKREIRKIFEFLKYDLLRLHREQIGQFKVFGISMSKYKVFPETAMRKVLKR